MKVSRGDIVLVDFPFSGGRGGKVRPALVVQNDRDNQRLKTVIVAMITSRTDRARVEATQLLIEIDAPDGKQTGLLMDSAINCSNLFTIDETKLTAALGRLSASLQHQIDNCPRAALGLS